MTEEQCNLPCQKRGVECIDDSYCKRNTKITEEIKYYKEKEYPLKWIPAEEMEETPQQTIERLKQENEKLKSEKADFEKAVCQTVKLEDDLHYWKTHAQDC